MLIIHISVLPVIFFYIGRRFPAMRKFHLPVFLVGGLSWAPYNMSYVWPTVPVGFLFNVYIKRRWAFFCPIEPPSPMSLTYSALHTC